MSGGTGNEQHSNAAAVHIWNSSDLSRFQSLTEPSAAHEARLTSFLSRDTVALGWNTIAPTLVLCPERQGEQDSKCATVLQNSSISLALVREVNTSTMSSVLGDTALSPPAKLHFQEHPRQSAQNEGLEPSKCRQNSTYESKDLSSHLYLAQVETTTQRTSLLSSDLPKTAAVCNSTN